MTMSTRSAKDNSSSVARKASISCVGRLLINPTVSISSALRLPSGETGASWVKGVEKPVLRVDAGVRNPIKKRGLARVCIAYERDKRDFVLFPPAAGFAADAPDFRGFFLEFGYAGADVAAVGLQLGFAGAAGAYRAGRAGGGLAGKIFALSGKPGQQIFILRQLDLELALGGVRALGENIEY